MFRRRSILSRIFSKLISILIVLTIVLSAISILFPLDYIEHIDKYSREYNLDPFLVSAVINVESKYKKDAVSSKDARGLMQIGPTTGKWAAEELNIQNYNENMLFIPETNIKIGTWYLNRLRNEFGENTDLILAAYNAGSGNVNKWRLDSLYSKDGVNLDNIPFKETAEYLVKVRTNTKMYRLFYSDRLKNMEFLGVTYGDMMRTLRKTILNISSSYTKEELM